MAKLNISFSPNAADGGSAAVPLDVIDDNLRRVASAPETLRLGETAAVDVEPGRYLVRAHMPTGEILSVQTRVGQTATNNVYWVPKIVSRTNGSAGRTT